MCPGKAQWLFAATNIAVSRCIEGSWCALKCTHISSALSLAYKPVITYDDLATFFLCTTLPIYTLGHCVTARLKCLHHCM